jgi:pimeloyl-ACP methyl ester carboxylesterase
MFLLASLMALILIAFLLVFVTERKNAPTGAFVMSNGVRLHYVDTGVPENTGVETAPVVLIHGASGNLRDFEASILPELAQRHRVIAFDRPGHGWSERPDRPDISDPAAQAAVIHEALLELGVEQPVVLGHSWGGAVASAYALAFPKDLRGLVVLAGATHAWEGPSAWYHRILAMPLVGTLFLWLVVIPFGRFLAPAGVASNFWPDTAPDDYAQTIGLSLLFRPRHFRHNSIDSRELRSHLRHQSKRYDEITTPTIVITGNRDQTLLAKVHSYAMHEQVVGSELIKLEGVGHMPHHVRPDVVLEAIERLAGEGTPKPGTHIHAPQTAAQKAAVSA